MKHTKEEILNALQIIKDECTDTAGCHVCPFARRAGSMYSCMFKADDTPEEWRIKREKESMWRAFWE
jgi:hypothetical protein